MATSCTTIMIDVDYISHLPFTWSYFDEKACFCYEAWRFGCGRTSVRYGWFYTHSRFGDSCCIVYLGPRFNCSHVLLVIQRPYASNVDCDIFAGGKRHLPCYQSYYTIRYLISIVWQHGLSQRSTMCETTKERRRQIYIPIQLLDPGDGISSTHNHRSLVKRAQLRQHRLVTLPMWSDTCSNTRGRNLKITASRQFETAYS